MNFEEVYSQISDDIQMSKDEALKLFCCAKMVLKGGIIVEIGTFRGGSAIIMAAATEANIYSIDIASEVIEKVKDFPNIKFIQGDSKEISITWDKGIEMLFIDGDHTFEGVQKDIINWAPKVKAGGIICFHDYGSRPELTRAITLSLEKRIGLPDNSLLAIIK